MHSLKFCCKGLEKKAKFCGEHHVIFFDAGQEVSRFTIAAPFVMEVVTHVGTLVDADGVAAAMTHEAEVVYPVPPHGIPEHLADRFAMGVIGAPAPNQWQAATSSCRRVPVRGGRDYSEAKAASTWEATNEWITAQQDDADGALQDYVTAVEEPMEPELTEALETGTPR